MICLNLNADSTDDARFIAMVDRLITGAVVTHGSAEVYVFKIDHWFDYKWMTFSGKSLGAVGNWRGRLTIPPFVANRIVDQRYYVRDDTTQTYQLAEGKPDIHYVGPSEDNLHRPVSKIAPAAALFWYSGDTAATGRGSLMGYIPVENDHWPWFLAFDRPTDWRVARRKGIHEYEVRMFDEAVPGLKVV